MDQVLSSDSRGLDCTQSNLPVLIPTLVGIHHPYMPYVNEGDIPSSVSITLTTGWKDSSTRTMDQLQSSDSLGLGYTVKPPFLIIPTLVGIRNRYTPAVDEGEISHPTVDHIDTRQL